MFDDYQIPVIILLALLMLAFSYLHRRFRSLRTLMWSLGMGCIEFQAFLAAFAPRLLEGVPVARRTAAAFWISASAESAILLGAVLFLASLSPLTFQLGKRRVLFAVPYLIPQLIYVALYYGVSQHPVAPLAWLYYGLAVWAASAAMIWSLQKGVIPIWLATAVVAFGIFLSVPFFMHGNVYWPLLVLLSANLMMTALLVIYTYRRLSPGVFLAVGGFLAWSLPPLLLIRPNSLGPHFIPWLEGVMAMGKVVVAMGLILLALEDEVAKNEAAGQRERRVRLELEAYARQAFTARNLDEFDRDSSDLCAMIVEHSRFSRVAMVVRMASGSFKLVGFAGMDGATAAALDALAQRMPVDCLDIANEPLVADSSSLSIELTPWLVPGDDLERLHLTKVGVVPMRGPDNSAEGALMLAAPRVPVDTLRADDLLPLEILAGRLQAARAQAMMLGKLIDSERFAGVGQLANNVAQQLNNPLTVILGYSALLEESIPSGNDRRGVEAISTEARRMKTMLERLSRFSRLSTERFNAFAIGDLITDVEQLHRTDFLRHSIEFRTVIESNLPEIFGNAHQIRQALLHVIQFAIETVQRVEANREKSIRIEAGAVEGMVRITLSHSGAGFPYPDRVFDSFSTGFLGSEATGIGLSLCAAIVREHRGNITAVNYEPTGAGVIMELPIS
jgi:signal transduction histidine kinase